MEFGKKFIQQAFKKFKAKGTAGSFTRWCKASGFDGVTNDCIKAGKKSKSLKTRRRAIFAQNIRPNYQSDIKYLINLKN
jgi:hypothetical protein